MSRYIIVGQGLAGSILAWELLKKKQQVLIFDRPDKNYSSSVAAGLFNPITGRRFVKTWKADLLFPYLINFYTSLEKSLQKKFFHPMPIYRPFFNISQQNDMTAKNTDFEFGSFIRRIKHSPIGDPFTSDTFGGIYLNQSGYLDIPGFLASMRDYFISKGNYRQECFEETRLIIRDDRIEYDSTEADKIIFCSGIEGKESQYFSWLPFRPVKGEILKVQFSPQPDFIYNSNIFILPFGNGFCKVGATYDWKNIDTEITEGAKSYLEKKLLNVLNVKFKTIDQQAGIRPASKDRRPLIGMHPELKNVGIFNGFGSKGVSLIPYFANLFVNYLINNHELESEININRYNYLY